MTSSDSYQNSAPVFINLTTDNPEGKEEQDEFIPDFADHAFKDYMYFWNVFLFQKEVVKKQADQPKQDVKDDDTESMDIDDDEQTEKNGSFLQATFNIIMSSSYQLIQNLDLTTIEKVDNKDPLETDNAVVNNQNLPTSGDFASLTASNPKDFSILVNLVEFLQVFLKKSQQFYWDWVYSSGEFWIGLSIKYPLISSFYKLLTVNFEICRDIGYFNNVVKKECFLYSRMVFINNTSPMLTSFIKIFLKGDENETNFSATEVQKSTYYLFSKYIHEILARINNYKDDLLISCLRLVLTAPVEICFFGDLSQIFQTSLRLGLGYNPLADLSLDALERWIFEYSGFGKNVLQSFYAIILPPLKDYLIINSSSEFNKESTQVTPIAKPKSAKKFSLKKLAATRQVSIFF